MKTRLTKTGWLFLWGVFLLYLASLTSQSSLLILLVGIFTGCAGINFVMARRIAKEVRIEAPLAECVPEGGLLAQSWHVTAPKKSAAGFIEIARAPDAKPILQIPHLEAGGAVAIVPALAFQLRGVYPHDQLEVASTFPFGLIRSAARLRVPGEVVVVPAVYSTECPPAAGYEPMLGGKFKGQRRSESGAEFAGVRPFQPGDSVKQIHWKSSSKGTGLMVKTFNEELSGRIGFILDCTHHSDRTIFDNAVRATGSLMFSALDQGHHVELVLTGDPETVHTFPPFADGEEMLQLLARLEASKDRLTSAQLERAGARLSKKSSVCLVVTELTGPIIGALSEWTGKRRPVSLYAPINTDFNALPHQITTAWFGKDHVTGRL